MNSLRQKRTLDGNPAIVIALILASVSFSMITPQIATAADVVGGEISEESFEGELAYLLLMQAYDLSNVNVDLFDYDILLNVPVQLENIHDNVDRFRIKCFIGSKDVNDPRARFDWDITYEVVKDLPGTEYNGTIQFPITVTPEDAEVYAPADVPDDVEPYDVNSYQCFLNLHDSETDSWSYTTPTSDELEYAEPWKESYTTFDDLIIDGYIEC